MKKILSGIIAVIIILGIGILIGRFAFKPKTVVEIVEVKEIVEVITEKVKIVRKNVYKMPKNELQAELLKYVEGEPTLNIEILPKLNTIRAKASLGDRKWSRDAEFKVKVHQSGNWKMYVGIGAGILAVGVTAGVLISRGIKAKR